MQNAGIGLVSFFESLRLSENNQDRKRIFTFIIENLKKGQPLADTLRRSGLLPVFDIPIIESGEKSGNLTRVCDILSKNYALSADAAKNVRSNLTKPFVTFALALFLPNFPDVFIGKISMAQYLGRNALILAIVLIVAFSLYNAFMKAYYDLNMARLKHKILSLLPVTSGLSKKMVLEKFCSSLAIMLDAGLPVFDAISLSGQTSADPELHMSSRRIISSLKSGKSLPEAFSYEPLFTSDIQNTIRLGSESGRLPNFLFRSSELLKKDINNLIEKISKMIPVIIYWVATLYVAWTIVGFYVLRMQSLNNMLNNI